jgi:uncharacterized repeat protein (TIGR03803 family)
MMRRLCQRIAVVLLTLAAPSGWAEGAFQLLHTFPSSANEPRLPGCRLLEVEEGVFYGTSLFGVAFNCGTVFRFRPDTGVEVIATFDGTNGFLPDGGLVKGPDGKLDGVTEAGGIGFSPDPPTSNAGPGTVFRVSLTGEIDTLFYFDVTNSATPFGPLVFGDSGEMYGVTFYGGEQRERHPFPNDHQRCNDQDAFLRRLGWLVAHGTDGRGGRCPVWHDEVRHGLQSNDQRSLFGVGAIQRHEWKWSPRFVA